MSDNLDDVGDSVQHDMEKACPRCGQAWSAHEGDEVEAVCPPTSNATRVSKLVDYSAESTTQIDSIGGFLVPPEYTRDLAKMMRRGRLHRWLARQWDRVAWPVSRTWRWLGHLWVRYVKGLSGWCDGGECMWCARLDCPFGDSLHYHHDGCPSCWCPERGPGGWCPEQEPGGRYHEYGQTSSDDSVPDFRYKTCVHCGVVVEGRE